MSHHTIRITNEVGVTTDVTVDPDAFDIKLYDGVLSLCACWCAEKLLKDNPRAYLAVAEAWPGRETVELTDNNGFEVFFTGTVKAAGYDKKSAGYEKKIVFLSAEEQGS